MRKPSLFRLSALCLTSCLAITPVWAHEHHDHQHEQAGHQAPDYSKEFAAARPAETTTVDYCWVRNIPTPAPSAGYFVVHNGSEKPVRLLAVQSPQYDDLMLHQTYDEDGMAKMKMADDIVIEPNSSLEFKPGGYHAMLEQPTSKVADGDVIEMTWLFDDKTSVTGQCEVRAASGRQKSDDTTHQH